MSRPFTLQVDEAAGTRSLQLDVTRGYEHGLTELTSGRPPIIFPIGVWATITDRGATAQYEQSSGEVSP